MGPLASRLKRAVCVVLIACLLPWQEPARAFAETPPAAASDPRAELATATLPADVRDAVEKALSGPGGAAFIANSRTAKLPEIRALLAQLAGAKNPADPAVAAARGRLDALVVSAKGLQHDWKGDADSEKTYAALLAAVQKDHADVSGQLDARAAEDPIMARLRGQVAGRPDLEAQLKSFQTHLSAYLKSGSETDMASAVSTMDKIYLDAGIHDDGQRARMFSEIGAAARAQGDAIAVRAGAGDGKPFEGYQGAPRKVTDQGLVVPGVTPAVPANDPAVTLPMPTGEIRDAVGAAELGVRNTVLGGLVPGVDLRALADKSALLAARLEAAAGPAAPVPSEKTKNSAADARKLAAAYAHVSKKIVDAIMDAPYKESAEAAALTEFHAKVWPAKVAEILTHPTEAAGLQARGPGLWGAAQAADAKYAPDVLPADGEAAELPAARARAATLVALLKALQNRIDGGLDLALLTESDRKQLLGGQLSAETARNHETELGLHGTMLVAEEAQAARRKAAADAIVARFAGKLTGDPAHDMPMLDALFDSADVKAQLKDADLPPAIASYLAARQADAAGVGAKRPEGVPTTKEAYADVVFADRLLAHSQEAPSERKHWGDVYLAAYDVNRKAYIALGCDPAKLDHPKPAVPADANAPAAPAPEADDGEDAAAPASAAAGAARFCAEFAAAPKLADAAVSTKQLEVLYTQQQAMMNRIREFLQHRPIAEAMELDQKKRGELLAALRKLEPGALAYLKSQGVDVDGLLRDDHKRLIASWLVSAHELGIDDDPAMRAQWEAARKELFGDDAVMAVTAQSAELKRRLDEAGGPTAPRLAEVLNGMENPDLITRGFAMDVGHLIHSKGALQSSRDRDLLTAWQAQARSLAAAADFFIGEAAKKPAGSPEAAELSRRADVIRAALADPTDTERLLRAYRLSGRLVLDERTLRVALDSRKVKVPGSTDEEKLDLEALNAAMGALKIEGDPIHDAAVAGRLRDALLKELRENTTKSQDDYRGRQLLFSTSDQYTDQLRRLRDVAEREATGGTPLQPGFAAERMSGPAAAELLKAANASVKAMDDATTLAYEARLTRRGRAELGLSASLAMLKAQSLSALYDERHGPDGLMVKGWTIGRAEDVTRRNHFQPAGDSGAVNPTQKQRDAKYVEEVAGAGAPPATLRAHAPMAGLVTSRGGVQTFTSLDGKFVQSTQQGTVTEADGRSALLARGRAQDGAALDVHFDPKAAKGHQYYTVMPVTSKVTGADGIVRNVMSEKRDYFTPDRPMPKVEKVQHVTIMDRTGTGPAMRTTIDQTQSGQVLRFSNAFVDAKGRPSVTTSVNLDAHSLQVARSTEGGRLETRFAFDLDRDTNAALDASRRTTKTTTRFDAEGAVVGTPVSVSTWLSAPDDKGQVKILREREEAPGLRVVRELGGGLGANDAVRDAALVRADSRPAGDAVSATVHVDRNGKSDGQLADAYRDLAAKAQGLFVRNGQLGGRDVVGADFNAKLLEMMKFYDGKVATPGSDLPSFDASFSLDAGGGATARLSYYDANKRSVSQYALDRMVYTPLSKDGPPDESGSPNAKKLNEIFDGQSLAAMYAVTHQPGLFVVQGSRTGAPWKYFDPKLAGPGGALHSVTLGSPDTDVNGHENSRAWGGSSLNRHVFVDGAPTAATIKIGETTGLSNYNTVLGHWAGNYIRYNGPFDEKWNTILGAVADGALSTLTDPSFIAITILTAGAGSLAASLVESSVASARVLGAIIQVGQKVVGVYFEYGLYKGGIESGVSLVKYGKTGNLDDLYAGVQGATGLVVGLAAMKGLEHIQKSFTPDTKGSTPADTKGTTPADTKGTTPADTKGTTPADTKGTTPPDTKGTTPADTKGTTPADTKGTTPADTKGGTPTDTSGTPPDTNGGTHPDTRGGTPPDTNGGNPPETRGGTPPEIPHGSEPPPTPKAPEMPRIGGDQLPGGSPLDAAAAAAMPARGSGADLKPSGTGGSSNGAGGAPKAAPAAAPAAAPEIAMVKPAEARAPEARPAPADPVAAKAVETAQAERSRAAEASDQAATARDAARTADTRAAETQTAAAETRQAASAASTEASSAERMATIAEQRAGKAERAAERAPAEKATEAFEKASAARAEAKAAQEKAAEANERAETTKREAAAAKEDATKAKEDASLARTEAKSATAAERSQAKTAETAEKAADRAEAAAAKKAPAQASPAESPRLEEGLVPRETPGAKAAAAEKPADAAKPAPKPIREALGKGTAKVVDGLKWFDANVVGKSMKWVDATVKTRSAQFEASTNPLVRLVRAPLRLSRTFGSAVERLAEKSDMVDALLIKGWRKVFGGGPLEYDAAGRRLKTTKGPDGREIKVPAGPNFLVSPLIQMGQMMQGRVFPERSRRQSAEEIWNPKVTDRGPLRAALPEVLPPGGAEVRGVLDLATGDLLLGKDAERFTGPERADVVLRVAADGPKGEGRRLEGYEIAAKDPGDRSRAQSLLDDQLQAELAVPQQQAALEKLLLGPEASDAMRSNARGLKGETFLDVHYDAAAGEFRPGVSSRNPGARLRFALDPEGGWRMTAAEPTGSGPLPLAARYNLAMSERISVPEAGAAKPAPAREMPPELAAARFEARMRELDARGAVNAELDRSAATPSEFAAQAPRLAAERGLEVVPVARGELFRRVAGGETVSALLTGEGGPRMAELSNWRVETDAAGRSRAVLDVRDPRDPSKTETVTARELLPALKGRLTALGDDAVGFVLRPKAELAAPKPAPEAAPEAPKPALPPKIEPALIRRALTEVRMDKDGPSPSERRAVRDSEDARRLRAEQNFSRTPDYPNSETFTRNSAKANDLFNRWLNGEESALSLRQTMEEMHKLYAGKGEIGKGEGGVYAEDGTPMNGRGNRTRDFVKNYFELEPNPDGAVALPGIPENMSPHFFGNRYFYPDSKIPGMRETYYKALDVQLTKYSELVNRLEAIKASDPHYPANPEYQGLVRESLETVADFGRVASAFRQFKNGNWGLYGPMMNSMVNRLGLEIKHPGYLDIILQGATERSVKPFFTESVIRGRDFYPADGYDPISGKSRAPPDAVPAAAVAEKLAAAPPEKPAKLSEESIAEPESPLKLPRPEKTNGLQQLKNSLQARGAADVLDLADRIYYTDPLTGLPNRAYFVDRAPAEIKNVPDAAVAMLDMNNFGAVNVGLADLHGVTQGRARADAVLGIAGATLGELGRAHGVTVVRLGGEEFVVLGPRAAVVEFSAAAKQVLRPDRLLDEAGMTRGGPERVAITAAMERMGRGGQPAGDFTYGIAELRGRPLKEAVTAADHALAHGKDTAGRGAITLETPEGYRDWSAPAATPPLDALPRAPPMRTEALVAELEARLTPKEKQIFQEAAFKDPLTMTRSYEYLTLKAMDWNKFYADGGMVMVSSARNLKQINDILGHDAGDLYLRKLGVVMRQAINKARIERKLDVQEPVRVASKEFMLVGKDAKLVAELAAQAVADSFDGGRMLTPEQVKHLRLESVKRGAVTEEGAKLIGTLRAVEEPIRDQGGRADVRGALDRAFISLEALKVAETKAGARQATALAPAPVEPLPPLRKVMKPSDLRSGAPKPPEPVAPELARYERYFSPAEILAAHPAPETGGAYHDWQHTVKVADMAREFAQARGLSPEEVKFVSEVGLLHDFDPTRDPGMPARVPETLARLRDDFAGTRSLTGEPGHSILKERFGWTEAQLKMAEAMIQRTEFPFGDAHPSPAYKGTSPLAVYDGMLKDLPAADRAFALREGALLSEYADKSSWYATETFDGAHKVVEGLVDEINRSIDAGNRAAGKPLMDPAKPVMDVGKLGTDGFLGQIGEPASFVHDQALAQKYGVELNLPGRAEAFRLLPDRYGRTFESNLEGFRVLNERLKANDPAAMDKARAAAAGTAEVKPAVVAAPEKGGVPGAAAAKATIFRAAADLLATLRKPVDGSISVLKELTGRGPPPAMKSLLDFGPRDWRRYDVDRVDIRERRARLSDFQDGFKTVNAELDAVRDAAGKDIKAAADKGEQKRLAAARDAEVARKLWEFADRRGPETMKADELMTVFNTFKDHGLFGDMVKLYDRAADPDFKKSVVVQQLLAVALHKTGNLERSEDVILARDEAHRSGEDYTILAKIYKLKYEEASKAGRTEAARDALNFSIEYLEKGFAKDYEYYPGINLVYNLMTRGSEFNDPASVRLAEEKAELVLLAAKKAGGLHTKDFWTLTTLLEAATITGQDREIEAAIPKVLASASADWMVQAPIDNLRKFRGQIEKMGGEGAAQRIARTDAVIKVLEDRLATLHEKVAAPAPRTRRGELTEAVLKQGHSFAEMARRLSDNGWALGEVNSSAVGGNIPYGGQLHSGIVNRWDFNVGRDLLKHLGLNEHTEFKDFNKAVDGAIRERFGTDKDDLENLHSDGHKVFDSFTKTFLDVMAVGQGGDSRTNIMVDFLLGKGDCRQHGYVKQLLFDIWRTDKMNALMREADRQLSAGDHSQYQRMLAEVTNIERMRMLTFDSLVNAPIALGPKGKYDIDLTENGRFKTDGVKKVVEDHTWNGLVEINDAGELVSLKMVDSFYQHVYKFGDGGAGIPVDLNTIKLLDEGGLEIVATHVDAVGPDGKTESIPVTLSPTAYAGNGKINPNRDDYEQVRLRGLEIQPAKPDFTAKTKASIDGFITRLLADEYRRQLQFDALTTSLKDKDFALEMAAWQDGAYYRGQGKEPPPFLTPEEKSGKVEKSVADEKIAMNLAGFYADESGIGVLSERTGKTPVEIVDLMAKGELDRNDMLLIARFANATWKAGQPFRSLDRITRDTFRPAVRLTNAELMKDFDQIKAAATKLSEKMADVRGAPRDAQLARLKELLQDKDFALEIAAWQDGAYYRGQGQTPPPFLTAEEKAGKVEKSVADEKVAMNLAGFYAVESGLGVLSETTGKSPRELLKSIVDGTMPEKDMLLIARFANATWKAGQPFRSMDRITRDTFRPAALLTDPELAKDFDQIKAAAQKLHERVAVLEVAAYDDKTRRVALKDLRASDVPSSGWRETVSHPIEAVRRLLGLRLLNDRQVEAVMSAHNDVPCNVYRCSTAELLAKARIMDQAGVSMSAREKLIREGYAGSLDEKFDREKPVEPKAAALPDAQKAAVAAGADQTASFAEAGGIGAPPEETRPPVPMGNIPQMKTPAAAPSWKIGKDGSPRLYSHIMEFELSPTENVALYRPRQIVGGGHTQAAVESMLKDVSDSLAEKRREYAADQKRLADLIAANNDPRMIKKMRNRFANEANIPPPPPGEHWTEKPGAVRNIRTYENGVRLVALPEEAYARNAWKNMMSLAKWMPGYEPGGKTLFPDGWTSADIKAATEEALKSGTAIKDDPFGKIVRGKASVGGRTVVVDVTLDSSGMISTTYPAWNQ